MKKCIGCGLELNDLIEFCPNCGTRNPLPQSNQNPQGQQNQQNQQNPYNQNNPYGQQQYGQQQYGQPQYNPQFGNQYQRTPDNKSAGYFFLGFFIPLAGFIIFFVTKDQTPLKAKSALNGAIVGVIFNVITVIMYAICITSGALGY